MYVYIDIYYGIYTYYMGYARNTQTPGNPDQPASAVSPLRSAPLPYQRNFPKKRVCQRNLPNDLIIRGIEKHACREISRKETLLFAGHKPPATRIVPPGPEGLSAPPPPL